MSYLYRHNHIVDSVRLHKKEKAKAFSFFYFFLLEKPTEQGIPSD